MRITVCFPTYNEGGNIKKVLEECLSVMSAEKTKWEILVIDNCSTDNTLDIVKKLAKKHKNISYIRHEKNQGYAASTRTALENAKGSIIFIIDSDGQHTARDIPKFIEKINMGYDIVVGWKVKRKDSIFRIIVSKYYNIFFNLLFGTRFHDVDCGFRAIKKEAAKKINIKMMHVPVGAELFAKAKLHNLKYTEVPVKHFPRKKGKSVFIPWKMPFTIAKIFIYLIRLKINLRKDI